MNHHTARVLIWLEIYNDCKFGATPVFDRDGHDELGFTLAGPYHDDVNIVFERPALERFVQLAREALELQPPKDAATDPPKLVSVAQRPNPRIAEHA